LTEIVAPGAAPVTLTQYDCNCCTDTLLDHGPLELVEAKTLIVVGHADVTDVLISVIVDVCVPSDIVIVYVPAGLLPSHALVASHVAFPLPSAVFVYEPLFGPV
jgi:hypothetical protein